MPSKQCGSIVIADGEQKPPAPQSMSTRHVPCAQMFALYFVGLRQTQTAADPQSASAAHSSYEQNVVSRTARVRPGKPLVLPIRPASTGRDRFAR